MSDQPYDVAIVGAGPAGLQAALVLARTRKRVVIFDSPQPARNSASHGVHNFLGLDGLRPAQIREQAWGQIAVYDSAAFRTEQIVDIQQAAPNLFSLVNESAQTIHVRRVILAMGYHDVYPELADFHACWGKTIIPCPFCDGYENRDRVWGIVPLSEMALDHLPTLAQNWASEVKVLLPDTLSPTPHQRETFAAKGISLYQGDITALHHTDGILESVTLNTGEKIAVETLIWPLPNVPTALTQRAIENFNLTLDDQGYIQTDSFYQTSLSGLFAVGDILGGWTGAIGAAFAGNQAAVAIIREWYV